MMTWDEVVAQLTAPGAPFEVAVETVHGRPDAELEEPRALAAREGRERGAPRRRGLHGPGRAAHLLRRVRAALLRGAAGRLARRPRARARAIASRSSPTTRPDWLIALFGAVSAGGIGVGLNGWWTTEEIEYGLRDSGSRFLVVDERLWPRVAPLAGRLEALETRLLHRRAAAAAARCRSRSCCVPATRRRRCRSTRTTPS